MASPNEVLSTIHTLLVFKLNGGGGGEEDEIGFFMLLFFSFW